MLHLEVNFSDHLFQLPDHFRAHQKLKRIINGIAKCLQQWQAWGVNYLSRKPVLAFNHPLGKEILPNVLNLFWCSFEPLPHVLSLDPRETSTSFSMSPPQDTAESNKVTLQSPNSLNQTNPKSQPLLIRHSFQLFHQLFCPLLDAFKHLNILLKLQGLELQTVLKVRLCWC